MNIQFSVLNIYKCTGTCLSIDSCPSLILVLLIRVYRTWRTKLSSQLFPQTQGRSQNFGREGARRGQ